MRPTVLILIILILINASCQNIQRSKPSKKLVESGKETPEWAPKKYKYRPSKTLKNDLLHTKLEISFDWVKKELLGKAVLTFKPYFYPQNILEVDAKGFDINSVQLVKKSGEKSDLLYKYDSEKLVISLNETYSRNDTFKVFIDYVAKPEKLKTSSGEAITSDKGLFFIVPDSLSPSKPHQIWTQGETESSSCWFPTIDSPNDKTTQEMYITVDDKYKTLSNGEFMFSTKHANGTRTDYWKQALPHSSYLFMMAVGEFSVVKDKWTVDKKSGKNIDVSYYVEPAYEKYARNIFGNTPEMITFFSNKLNYAYPWAKYSSVVVREYVSGAMENTSATVFMDGLQKTSRELIDENYDNIISHELFHHWFGDLVTCESWANLPLNESFATYAEYLWAEYKYGADEAELARHGDMEQYLSESEIKKEPLIRYFYKNPDDMFDSHSYAKGGCVLHMLRKHVGDEAFFKSLNLYLKRNEFRTAEIHQLRMVFEEVTGEDLNWFFNQWFMSPGHPELLVSDSYMDGKLHVNVFQQQDTTYMPIYNLPVKIDVWTNGNKKTLEIVINKYKQEFKFDLDAKPDVVVFDEEHLLLAQVEHKKTISELIKQYEYAKPYMARFEVLEKLYELSDSSKVRELMLKALDDSFWKIREMAIDGLDKYRKADTTLIIPRIADKALKDKNSIVRAAAIGKLSRKKRPEYENIYLKGLSDSSYAVVGASLLAYLKLKPLDADAKLHEFENENNKDVVEALSEYYSSGTDSTKYQWYVNKINTLKAESSFYIIQDFGRFLVKSSLRRQKEGVRFLTPLAEKNSHEWVRFSAYQALNLLEIDEIKSIKKRIRENEKSERLKNIYKYLP